MNTFKIDFHINPYIVIYGPADMNKLTQFWFGNLLNNVPSYTIDSLDKAQTFTEPSTSTTEIVVILI